MKSHKGELVKEISKLQAMVLELRSGFSRALLELNQIQLGDTELQNQLEETRHGCNKRTLHLETHVLTLKDELEEIRCQIRQLCDEQVKSEQTNSNTGSETDSAPGCSGVKDFSGSANGVKNVNEVMGAPSLGTPAGALLLHCYLQGLWAGHNLGDVSSHFSLIGEGASGCTQTGRRECLSISLLKSEWEYFTKLSMLQEKYRTPTSTDTETHKVFVRHVDEMVQRHLLFRNCLQQTLSSDGQKDVMGDAFLKLTTQDNSAFCDAYLGYAAALATILTSEFSRDPTDKPHNTEEEAGNFQLLSLLLAPVTHLRTYLNSVQALLSCSSGEHSDWHTLHRSNQVLRNLYTRCHMTLERTGQWNDGTGRTNKGTESVNGLSSRCCAQSPECARSAFTKYSANGHQKEPHHLTVPRPLLAPAGILRNSRERLCEPLPTWDFRAVECHPVPVPQPQNLLLNPGAQREFSASIPALKSPSGLAERLCGSPGPDGRVCRANVYTLPQRIDDADTDADVGDASVFDYSSVTTCSPDDTLELRGQDEDEEDDEEDSEIPVLLKPSYTHSHAHTHSGGGLQRQGGVCTRWQIPRAAALPPEVCVAGTGTGRRMPKHRRKIPTGAFRPIWDAPFKQGDGAPTKENTVSFSSTHQIINPQGPTDSSRSVYRSVCSEGTRRWNGSDDSEGPCSNV